MRCAIALARRGNGDTHPNPMVGSVIVENGKIVAEGYHARAGTPHAERNALSALGRRPAPGATLYVTLEPCSTHGRTGACTDAIIAAGISRVVIGAIDPNPNHAGAGIRILQAAGIETLSGVLAEECTRLNPVFNHFITTGTPLFALKTAMTLDGHTATRHGESQWITGSEARADVMRLRRYFPAIATGSGTVLADNPSLTARVPGEAATCPVRFIFDRRLRTLEKIDELKVFNDEFASLTILVTTAQIPPAYEEELAMRNVAVWQLSAEFFWQEFRSRLAEKNLCGVLFEAGAKLLGGLLGTRQANYLYAYIAPKIFGDAAARPAFDGCPLEKLADARMLSETHISRLGDDFLIEGKLQ